MYFKPCLAHTRRYINIRCSQIRVVAIVTDIIIIFCKLISGWRVGVILEEKQAKQRIRTV